MNALHQLIALLSLARWLGPWTKDADVPYGVLRDETEIEPKIDGDRPVRAWVYRSQLRAPFGSLLLLPGLHYLGPSDPRLDRFARVLAASGVLVYAPFLPDYIDLTLRPSVLRDAERALDALLAWPDRPRKKPGLMSISFGSLPALHLASSEVHSQKLSSLVLFGGYADLGDTMRFCLEGSPGSPHDPLNRPVVFMNLIEHLPDPPADPAPLLHAWNEYIQRTWGRPELKHNGLGDAIGREICSTIRDDRSRQLFEITTGLAPGAIALLEHALERGSEKLRWLDPTERVRAVKLPTFVLHGADDDVIPHTHARMFERALPKTMLAGVHVTGLYGHTGSNAAPWAKPAELLREVKTLVGALRALSRAAAG